jgi:hypothetical protein
MIRISHSKNFYLLLFPKFTFCKAIFDVNSSMFNCDIAANLIYNNTLHFIDLSKKKFTRLHFEKHSCQKPILNLGYPTVLPIFSFPKLDDPLDVNAKTISIHNKPVSLNGVQPTTIIHNPIDLNITNNIEICQTVLNHQIQSYPVLNQ